MNDRPIRSAAEWRARHIAGSPPKIMQDAELAAFVNELLPRSTFAEISRRALERFGQDRAPSKSAIGRYWRRLTDPDGPNIAPGGPVHGRAGECLWCGARLKSAAQRPSKRFCGDRCRQTMHSAARRYAIEEVAAGRLAIAELRRYAGDRSEAQRKA